MRRPGRIDQILQLDQPARPVVEQIVRELAVREGVEIPAERLPALVEIGCEMSIAHVVEALRRARVEGWQHTSLPCDITFGEGFVEDSRERSPDEATRALANLARNGVPLAELRTSLQRILLKHARN